MQRIDLHTHSAVSDGTDTPRALMEAAAAAGLDAIALTDHDTVAGWAEAESASAEYGVALIPGIEVSTRHEGRSVHVLALLVDPAPSTRLAQTLESMRTSRLERAQAMVAAIGADHPLSWDDVDAVARDRGAAPYSVGRPHIADALIRRGVVRDRTEAFAGILAPRSPYYVPYRTFSTADAIQQIHEAGGVAIAAHALSASRRRDAVPDAFLESLIESGIDGFEVHHREHSERDESRLADIVTAHGLIATGGSDYHGTGKPNRLGENLTAPESLDAIIHRATGPTGVRHP